MENDENKKTGHQGHSLIERQETNLSIDLALSTYLPTVPLAGAYGPHCISHYSSAFAGDFDAL